MKIHKIAAFTEDGSGGNPAGVVLADKPLGADIMQRVAAEVGYSETAFASPEGDLWATRYFSPEGEVPFCGMPPSHWARFWPLNMVQGATGSL